MSIKVLVNTVMLCYFVSVAMWGFKASELIHSGFSGERAKKRRIICIIIMAIWLISLLAVLVVKYFV